MATIKINGNLKLSALKARFFDELGVNIDVLAPDGQRADDSITVAQLRDRTPKSSEISVVGQSKVATVESTFANDYGIRINVLNPDGTEAPQTATIGSIQRQYADAEPLPQEALIAIQHAAQLNDWMEFWTYVKDPAVIGALPKNFRERTHEQMLIDGLRLAPTFDALYVFLYNGSQFAPGRRLLAAARDVVAGYDMAAMSVSDLVILARVAHEVFADRELALLAFDNCVERASDSVDFSMLLDFANDKIHDAGRTQAVLDAAWRRDADLDFCLKMSSCVNKSLEDTQLATQWYSRAVTMVTDWRHQYCAVGTALHVLKDPQLATQAFDAQTWLSSRGFTMNHGFPLYGSAPATMVLLSPEGAWNNDGDLRAIAHEYRLADLMASEQNQSVAVLLRPGEYRGPVECLIAYSEIAAVGSREKTIITATAGITLSVRHCWLDLFGLTIVCESDGESHEAAVVLNGQGSIKLVNCVVSSPGQHGIVVRGGFEAHAEISDSIVTGADIGMVAAGGTFAIHNCEFVDIGDAAIVKSEGVEIDCSGIGTARIRHSDFVDEVWLTSLAPQDSGPRGADAGAEVDEDGDVDKSDEDEDEGDCEDEEDGNDDDGVAAEDDDDVEFWSAENFSGGGRNENEDDDDGSEVDESDDDDEDEDCDEDDDEDGEVPSFGEELAGDVVCIGLHIAARLGDPLAKSEGIMRMLDRWRWASPTPVSSGDALLRDCFANGRAKFEASRDATCAGLPEACIGRICVACWSAQIEYLMNELTEALLPPPVIPTPVMAYVCDIANELNVQMPAGLHRHYAKNTSGMAKTLAELVRAGVVFKLYDNVAIWGCDERDFDAWEVMPYRLVFNKHLFGIWFGGSLQAQPPLLADFLNARLPEGWESHVFPESGVRAAFGIFNSIVNVMLGVALDDKGEVVLSASDGARCSEYWLSNFGERDNARVVSEILRAVGLVGKWRHQDAAAGDAADAGAEAAADASEMLAVLRIAIPTIPATFGSAG